jgi:hypothetical protein
VDRMTSMSIGVSAVEHVHRAAYLVRIDLREQEGRTVEAVAPSSFMS